MSVFVFTFEGLYLSQLLMDHPKILAPGVKKYAETRDRARIDIFLQFTPLMALFYHSRTVSLFAGFISLPQPHQI